MLLKRTPQIIGAHRRRPEGASSIQIPRPTGGTSTVEGAISSAAALITISALIARPSRCGVGHSPAERQSVGWVEHLRNPSPAARRYGRSPKWLARLSCKIIVTALDCTPGTGHG